MQDGKTNAEKLKAWRASQGISQAKAAERVGAAQKSWDEWEDGIKVPGLRYVVRIERETDGAVPAIGWVGDDKPAPRRRRARRPSAASSG